MADEKKLAVNPVGVPAKTNRLQYLQIALSGLNLVLSATILFWMVFINLNILGPTGEEPLEPTRAISAAKPKPPLFLKLDTYTVNLQGGSVLQTEVHVQVADEKGKERVTHYLPRISSQVNLLLRGKRPDELTTAEGTKRLMSEIKAAINQVLEARDDAEGVQSVEFKTFIVQ